MGNCCNYCKKCKKNKQQLKEKKNHNDQQEAIVENVSQIQQNIVKAEENKPAEVNKPTPSENNFQIEKVIPQPKEKERSLDIREVNLLDRISTISIEPSDSCDNENDVQIFEKIMEEILSKTTFFQNNKASIVEELEKNFNQDSIEQKDQSQNNDFKGPKIVNRNICDIQNKYDFSKINEFTEYKHSITLVRLIQKQKSPICTFIGKIEEKYCCVKLIPMVNVDHINQWIQRVRKLQSQKNLLFLNEKCQKYYYYKIEKIDKEPDYCNCYIISQLEQFNVYTVSRHPKITFAEKLLIACEVIQIISLVLQDKTEKANQQIENISQQIFGNMMTVKRNNILISRFKKNEQHKQFNVVLSDWQLLLPEFEVIIPNQKLQNQDELYKKTKQQIEDLQNLSSNRLALQKSQNSQDQNAKQFFEKQKELDQFTKQILKLLLFKANYDLDDELNLIGFFNQKQFQDKCNILNNIEKHQQLIIKKQIENYQNINENQNEIIRQISYQMFNLLQLSDLNIQDIIYEIYLNIDLIPCERSKAILLGFNESILKNQINV
ncbi:unnamed protein product [Paramecium sonneborni]|uniref:Uncharacterized protein n=1 Tax=Paramecium sonneborni TaxID=65129 RepID=A0A8S1M5N1_9CILI|nr:unnamed protein product [Paramecium sonneborni]